LKEKAKRKESCFGSDNLENAHILSIGEKPELKRGFCSPFQEAVFKS